MYVTVTPVDLATIEKILEANVFYRRFGNTASELVSAYRPYTSNSVFLSCWTQAHELVGTMRLTLGATGSLKTLDDLSGPPWSLDISSVLRHSGLNPRRCWDIVSIAVRPSAARSRGGAAADCLKRALYVWSVNSEVQAWTAMLDDRVLGYLRQEGIPLNPLPGAFSAPYMGSPQTTPVSIAVAGLAKRMALSAPRRHATLILGRGLEELDLSALTAKDPRPADSQQLPRAA